MDIDEMTPEELRLAIAKARNIEAHYPFDGRFGPYMVDGETVEGRPYLVKLSDWPNDIRAAWELVEEFWQSSIYKLEDGYLVYVYAENKNAEGYKERVFQLEARGETAAIAICRAYLKWKEG